MSFPHWRAANLILGASHGTPLEDRYLRRATLANLPWTAGLIEAVLASGDGSADRVVDGILIAGADFYQWPELLDKIGKKKYREERTGISIKLPDNEKGVRVTQDNVREIPFEQIKKPLQDAFSKNYIAASLLNRKLDPEKKREILGGRIEDDYSKLMQAKTRREADKGEFESLENLVQNLFQDSRELFFEIYRSMRDRDVKVAKALLMFLTEEQIKGLVSLKAFAEINTDLIGELALRALEGRVLQVETQSAYDQSVANSKKPVLVVFGAAWCDPCQAIKPRLEHWARFYNGEIAVAYVHIDRDDSLDKIFKATGGRGLPAFAIFHKRKLELAKEWLNSSLRGKLNKLLKAP